ncbi:hypothetical protein [Frankia tisae]|uniref:hypothetical protein n=1 Tax=Frankia tisae TaxID=2950104 RepID=UPI0021BE115A|nr:hypothetical protein [Frankia tisae]
MVPIPTYRRPGSPSPLGCGAGCTAPSPSKIYGHLRSVTGDPTMLYHDELVGLVRSLHLDVD